VLDLGIDLNVWPWVWLGVAVFFALIELTVLAGSFVLLPFAVSALGAALLGFYDVAIEIQWLVFLGGGPCIWGPAVPIREELRRQERTRTRRRRRPSHRPHRHRHHHHRPRRHRPAGPHHRPRRGLGCHLAERATPRAGHPRPHRAVSGTKVTVESTDVREPPSAPPTTPPSNPPPPPPAPPT
jgi:hypothetical protein